MINGEENMLIAFDIFRELEHEGVLSNKEKIIAYNNEEIRDYVEDFARRSDMVILEADQRLYMVRNVHNNKFMFTNEELREKIFKGKKVTNVHLYLAYFTIMVLLAKYYNSDEQTVQAIQFLAVEDLEKEITKYLGQINKFEENVLIDVMEKTHLDLEGISKVWNEELGPYEEDKTKSAWNKIGFLFRVLNFLKEEDLVTFYEETNIRLTEKMVELINLYYFNSSRKNFLLELLKRPLEEAVEDLVETSNEIE
ncbi:DUF6063 family protein [Anaerobacillus isosaccharinicus]|uniref:Non-ribosomal peptide synthetase module n=1 Tax=Anaerobacillus isosaccharinicus TaxID=1532552 RepID=A0A1S2LBZ9_9BACI|nr:DUF6063 family protein [Anaerobacillus isosaccharinicus]MBA5584845.1 hypothetical protein [Anaerobacillus isosaccharinicus]QOY36792.1 hypothetical protein AWH56_003815 [Anaerobacillus isosaccharinicus]